MEAIRVDLQGVNAFKWEWCGEFLPRAEVEKHLTSDLRVAPKILL